MTTFNFSGLTNSNTWSDAAFVQDATTTFFGQMGSDATGGAGTGALKCGTLYGRAFYAGQTWGNIISSEVTPQGIRGFPVTDDTFSICLVVEASGVDRWKGYYWIVANGYQRIIRVDVQNNAITTGNTSLGTGTTVAVSTTSAYKLSFNKTTGVIVASIDGTQVDTATDTTYTSGLAPGFAIMNDNHGGTGVSKLVATGNATGSGVTQNLVDGSTTAYNATQFDWHIEQTFGGTITDFGNALATDASGNLILSGLTATVGSAWLWVKKTADQNYGSGFPVTLA